MEICITLTNPRRQSSFLLLSTVTANCPVRSPGLSICHSSRQIADMAATGTERCLAEPVPNEEMPALPGEPGLESQTETST